jgi:hypothetical protein
MKPADMWNNSAPLGSRLPRRRGFPAHRREGAARSVAAHRTGDDVLWLSALGIAVSPISGRRRAMTAAATVLHSSASFRPAGRAWLSQYRSINRAEDRICRGCGWTTVCGYRGRNDVSVQRCARRAGDGRGADDLILLRRRIDRRPR